MNLGAVGGGAIASLSDYVIVCTRLDFSSSRFVKAGIYQYGCYFYQAIIWCFA